MGADGHIRIYDAEKVNEVVKEMKKEHGDDVYFPGYQCSWECNGKKACLIYWGDNIISWPFSGFLCADDPDSPLRKLEKKIEPFILVEDQEVWT